MTRPNLPELRARLAAQITDPVALELATLVATDTVVLTGRATAGEYVGEELKQVAAQALALTAEAKQVVSNVVWDWVREATALAIRGGIAVAVGA